MCKEPIAPMLATNVLAKIPIATMMVVIMMMVIMLMVVVVGMMNFVQAFASRVGTRTP